MSSPEPQNLASQLDALSEQQRIMFFEQVGLMCSTWGWTQTFLISRMFPPRSNRSHQSSLDMCRKYVRDHGYLTRSHVNLKSMAASTFRRSILAPLLAEGAITDSGETWKEDGQGQGQKVYRDRTNRYRALTAPIEPVANNSLSIVNEPGRTAEHFVSNILTRKEVLRVGFTKMPGLMAYLGRIGYTDVTPEKVKEWGKVVADEIRKQAETNPVLKVYRVHNGKISLKTTTGVMRNE
jgi:hypothetical protein